MLRSIFSMKFNVMVYLLGDHHRDHIGESTVAEPEIMLSSDHLACWHEIQRLATEEKVVHASCAYVGWTLSLEPEIVAEAADRLASAGLISRHGDDGVCLTPLSASSLGLRARRVSGELESVEWAPIHRGDRKERKATRRATNATDLDVNLDSIAGDQIPPDQIVEASEEYDRRAPRPDRRLTDTQADPERLPYPSVLIEGCQVWDATTRKGSDCPAYCLRCNRWALDWLIDRIRRSEARAEVLKARAAAEAERCRKARSLGQRRATKGKKPVMIPALSQ